MTQKRVLVTGAAGFIGSHVADRFAREGWRVTGVDNLSSGNTENVGSDWELIVNNFDCDHVLRKILQGQFDVVCHQAAMPRVLLSVEQPAKTNEVNVSATVRLLEVCKGNIDRFVFASSSSVYGNTELLPTHESTPKNPRSPYALQKSIIEDYLAMFYDLYDMDSVCLRYFNVFGPRSRGDSAYATAVAAWLDAIKEGKPLRSDGDGEQSRDLCYVDNVVQANWLAATKERHRFGPLMGRCYNVACGDRTTNNDILALLEERFGELNILHAPERAGDVKHTQADISRIKEELGYKDPVSFIDGLKQTIEWYGFGTTE